MKQEAVTIGLKNEGNLYALLSAPDEPLVSDIEKTLVVMIHDIPYGHYRAHEDLYSHIRNSFDDNGYRTLMFDFESCGESDGKQEDLSIESVRQNLKEVLLWAQRRGFNKFIFVASGAAAAIALEFADEKTHMVFLFWPVVNLASHAKKILYDEFGDVVAKGRKIGHDLITHMEEYDPAIAMKSLKIPILIQYGAQDDIVSFDHTDYIKENFKALRIDVTSYQDGGNGLTDSRHRRMMAHHINAFLQKYS